MKQQEIYEKFKQFFPNFEKLVTKVEKTGSRVIRLTLENSEVPLLFLYYSDNNWSFGTNLWRKRPGETSGNWRIN